MGIPKIDIRKLDQMLRAGKSQIEIAKYFSVTPGAVSQAKRQLKNNIVRTVALEKANEVVESHLDMMGQLRKINSAINDELDIQREISLDLRNPDTRMERVHIIRLAGPDCFNKKPDYRGGGQGPSTAEVFAEHGIYLSPGDPNRALKIRQFHERLRLRDDEPPMMLIYDTCEHFIRTIPLLQADPHNVEDIDTTMEDHCYDEAALVCMGRPISMELPKKRKSSYDRRIDRLIRGDRNSWEFYAMADQQKTFNDLGIGGVDYDDDYEETNPYDDGDLLDTIMG
jgi:hypothetical protein